AVQSVVLFSWSVLLRVLHAFPTRRSSDLQLGLDALVLGDAAHPPGDAAEHQRDRCDGRDGRREHPLASTLAQLLAVPGERELERSEEHTSELQSRENLVCRLLLEKKNNDK